LAAAREARAQAGLPDGSGDERWASVVGTGLGGIASHERAVRDLAIGRHSVSAYTAVAMVPSAAAAAVAIEAGARGPALAPATACASGADAIGLGADLIRLGRADVVLAGAADAPIGAGTLSAFAAVGAAADRTGLVVGEGAAVLVLESAGHAARRGAAVLAEVLGYASTNDAHHLSAPDPDGTRARAALVAALHDAGVGPAGVGYVNAHGTGTVLNDRVEAGVLAGLLGDRVPVSATKSMTGHLMGACGALEAAVCVQVLRTGIVPATRNCTRLDPDCAGIDLVRTGARTVDVPVALSPSFGFGGYNAVLVLGRA